VAEFCFDDFTVDMDRLEVRRHELVLALEPKAFRVLVYLIQNRERAVSKEELIEKVWAGIAVGDNALTRVIAQIRRQLGDNAREPRYIETLATTGYRFVAPVSEDAVRTVKPPLRPQVQWAITAITIAIVIAIGVRQPNADASPKLAGLRQFTNSSGADLWPSFSPDGSQVVYSSTASGDFQIHVRSLAPGSVDRQLTSGAGESIQPAWSPDGQYIAYASRLHGGIGVVPVSGGASRWLTQTGDSPRWSPDGRTLVYRASPLNDDALTEGANLEPTSLSLVEVASGVSRELTKPGTPPGGHIEASWMRDGQRVLFASETFTSSKLWWVDRQTGAVQQIEGPQSARAPLLAPDARWLYWIGAQGLVRANLRGNRTEAWEALVPAGAAVPRDLAISADGRHIALSQEVISNGLWTVPLDKAAAPAGPPRALIADRNLRHAGVHFNPDGSRLTYSSVQRGGPWSVFVANADGSSAAAVSPGDQGSFSPAWVGPDLAYIGYRSGKRHLWLNPAASAPREIYLKMDLDRMNFVQISRDGKKLLGQISTAQGFQIAVEDLETHTLSTVTPAERSIGFGFWSPDGKWIAAAERIHGDSHLVILPAEGGEVKTLVDAPSQNFAYDWSPDGQRISFAGLRDGVWNVYWVSRSTGKVQQLTQFQSKAAFVRYPAWSPKGDQVVFEYNDTAANIYVGELK
jgi:Tol biopolymer transport system component/DNA-binding winged helix-turn-helix (wHTH) protein